MNMILGLFGDIGVILLLLAYFLLTIGHIKAADTHHLILNLLAALFIIIALLTGNTVPVLYTLVLWLFISLFGFYKHHLAITE